MAFAPHDNLMLAAGIIASGGGVIAEAASHAERVARCFRSLRHARRLSAATVAFTPGSRTFPGADPEFPY